MAEQAIIARAYASEPVKVTAIRLRSPGILEIYRERRDITIGWIIGNAYEFDETTFLELKTAYESGDKELLAAKWCEAKKFSATVFD